MLNQISENNNLLECLYTKKFPCHYELIIQLNLTRKGKLNYLSFGYTDRTVNGVICDMMAFSTQLSFSQI